MLTKDTQRALLSEFWLAFVFLLPFLSNCQPAAAQQPTPQPLKQDEACLACHGQAGFKSEKGRDISIRPEAHAGSAHGILACKDCHTAIKDFPHPAKIPKVQCATCHAEESTAVPRSVHLVLGEQACASCHGNVHEIAATKLAPARCSECHRQEVQEFAESAHGRAAKAGDPDAPTCESCHGPVHAIHGSTEPATPLAKQQMAATCAKCHSNPNFLARHKMPIAHPIEQYLNSAHGQAVALGKNAASCSDCHGTHGILRASEERSRVNHWRVAATCGTCHQEIAKTYFESVHGQAMKAGMHDAPVCTDCHGEHLILPPKNPASPVSVANVSVETCGRCHGDARLVQRHDLPADRVPSYADSYHGLAFREGSLRAANCASCHGVHNIFRSGDARSTVNAANLGKTCGKCHEGLDASFAMGPVHVQTSMGPAHPVVKSIRWIYWVLIPLTLAFMVLHNALDLFAKMLRGVRRAGTGERVVRMNLWFRIAHWGVMLSFPTLVYTGFALKYPEEWWARPLLQWEEHISFRGSLHRAAAVVLIAATLYHFVHLAVNRRDRAFLRAILPKWQDASDLVGVSLFNLGLRREEPRFAKFNYAEKLEYWAFLWGTAIMTLSGFLLWINNFALRHFPKWVLDAATAVHWYEALLATFSILLWHFYMVIFDPLVYPMDLTWLTGKASAEHYRHSRPKYFRFLEKSAASGQQAKESQVQPQSTETAVMEKESEQDR
jgi:cytochrome b subunit of formate dehydrogenase/DnaJ-class molecular chaperone